MMRCLHIHRGVFDNEVAELVPLSDGVDIFWRLRRNLLHFKIFCSKTLPYSQNWLPSLDGGSCSLEYYTTLHYPKFTKQFLSWTASEMEPSSQQVLVPAFLSLTLFTRSHSSLLVRLSSARHFVVHSCRAFTFALWRLLYPAPKPNL